MDNTLLRGEPHVLAVAVDATVGQYGSPFSGLNKILLNAVSAATLYGVLRPPKNAPLINNQGNVGLYAATGLVKHVRLIADGTKTEWDAATYLDLANLHNDAGTLTTAARLRIVVEANGRVIQRVVSTGTVTGPNFRALLNTTMRLQTKNTGAAAWAAGTVLDVFIFEAGDIVAQTAGAVPTEGSAYDFMTAATQAVSLAKDGV